MKFSWRLPLRSPSLEVAASRSPGFLLVLAGVVCLSMAGDGSASGFCDGDSTYTGLPPRGGTCHQIRVVPHQKLTGSPAAGGAPLASTLDEECLSPLADLGFRFHVDPAGPDQSLDSVLTFLKLDIALLPTGTPPGTALAAVTVPSGIQPGHHLLTLRLHRGPGSGNFLEMSLDESWPANGGGDPTFGRLASMQLAFPDQEGWIEASLFPSSDWTGLSGQLGFTPSSAGGNVNPARSIVATLPVAFDGIGLEGFAGWPHRLQSGLIGGSGDALQPGARTELFFTSLVGHVSQDCLSK